MQNLFRLLGQYASGAKNSCPDAGVYYTILLYVCIRFCIVYWLGSNIK